MGPLEFFKMKTLKVGLQRNFEIELLKSYLTFGSFVLSDKKKFPHSTLLPHYMADQSNVERTLIRWCKTHTISLSCSDINDSDINVVHGNVFHIVSILCRKAVDFQIVVVTV